MSRKKNRSRQAKQTSSRNLKLWGGVAALAVLVVIIVFFVMRQAAPYPPDMSPGEAAAQRDGGALILDVRTQAEWTEGHIPGSMLIPLDELPNRLNELPRDKAIIVVCRTGVRSAQGRDMLRKAGFTRVASLTGGVTEWKAQGSPTVSGVA